MAQGRRGGASARRGRDPIVGGLLDLGGVTSDLDELTDASEGTSESESGSESGAESGEQKDPRGRFATYLAEDPFAGIEIDQGRGRQAGASSDGPTSVEGGQGLGEGGEVDSQRPRRGKGRGRGRGRSGGKKASKRGET